MKSHESQPPAVAMAEALSANTLLSLKQVSALVGLTKTPIYRRISESTFPAPLKLSSRASRWRAGDILRWLEAQSSELSPTGGAK